VIVRRAGVADAELLAALHGLGFSAPWNAVDLAALIAAPGAFALLAEAEGAPAGFILCRTAADEAEVLTLTTTPERRRGGVARALIGAAVDAARAAGAGSLFLEVASDNAPALALYRDEGFTRVGERAGYYERRDRSMDALVLRRPLNRPVP